MAPPGPVEERSSGMGWVEEGEQRSARRERGEVEEAAGGGGGGAPKMEHGRKETDEQEDIDERAFLTFTRPGPTSQDSKRQKTNGIQTEWRGREKFSELGH